MSITALDIHNKEFRTVLRGYDRNEVDEFLDQVIKDIEHLMRENAEYRDKNVGLGDKLEHYHRLEQTLHNALVVAQETAEEVKGSAKKEAQLITKEAELKAERMVDEAISKVRRMSSEVSELRKQAEVFRARLSSMLKAQMEMLEEQEWDNLDNNGGRLA